jgi:hypothetical protein
VYIDVSWLKIDLRDIGCGSVDWIELAQHRMQLQV